MNCFRLRFTLPVLGLCLAAGLFAGLGADASSAAVQSAVAAKPTTIVVTAGKPSELAFKLSKFSNIPAGAVTFKVTNEGLAYHTFKICTTPVTSAAKNSCVGKETKLLKHGQSATLTVKLTKSGKYEYLCTVSGHAAAGMKGLIGIHVAVKAAAATTTTTTTAALTGGGTTTTTTASSGSAQSAPPSGPDGCPGGTSIASNTPTTGGDGDVDDSGQQSDGDGCV
jgi:uncharacterized cupredoxin-like copper-binding protein